jgi:cell division septation protein DedD
MQEDTRQQMARLEEKARKAGHLSYAALGLSVAALCVGLTAGYLNFQTRAEQIKLKEMQTVFEEDMNSLSEKFDNNNQAAEDSAETSSSLTDESIIIPRKNPIAVDESPPPVTELTQAAVKPAPGIVGKKVAAPPMHKGVAHQSKPALKTASRKPSRNLSANETEANWTVNLASFKQIQEARKKAAEFRKKGISVKVTKVDIKRTTWYRLSVSGFKTRQAASTQSTRLKKLLRLNSIWVAAI